MRQNAGTCSLASIFFRSLFGKIWGCVAKFAIYSVSCVRGEIYFEFMIQRSTRMLPSFEQARRYPFSRNFIGFDGIRDGFSSIGTGENYSNRIIKISNLVRARYRILTSTVAPGVLRFVHLLEKWQAPPRPCAPASGGSCCSASTRTNRSQRSRRSPPTRRR